MFEICQRHRPVFAVSQVRQVAHLLTESLGLGDLAVSGIEILDIAQTARINENNRYVVKSALSPDAVLAALQKSRRFQDLTAAHRAGTSILDRVLATMIQRLQVDSWLGIGASQAATVQAGLPQATASSKRPLLIFDSTSRIDYAALDSKWFDADHPAVWLGSDWLSAVEGAEAFFAVSPALKLEVSLNRYQPLAGFGEFAIGLVRL